MLSFLHALCFARLWLFSSSMGLDALFIALELK
jgi:hypothetical protein